MVPALKMCHFTFQKSEFETLVEFQIQYQEEKVMKKHFETVRNTLKKENDKKKCQKSVRKQLNVNPTGKNLIFSLRKHCTKI